MRPPNDRKKAEKAAAEKALQDLPDRAPLERLLEAVKRKTQLAKEAAAAAKEACPRQD